MKDFLKNNKGDIIWYLLCIITVLLGVFVDVSYGFFVVLLIGIHFYIEFENHLNRSFTEFDRYGSTFIALLFHCVIYIGIISIVSIIIDKEEIKELNSYEVKFLENEKIVINIGNNIEIIDNAKLYWECKAKNCKNIIITIITENPANPIFSKDLILKQSTVFSVN
jgi:hypothetical protein